jgi:biopolymer transport protein ExbD
VTNLKKKNRRHFSGQIASINMVSLIDVLMVLLIFFMFIEISQNNGAFMLHGRSGSAGSSAEKSKTIRINYGENGDIHIFTPSGEEIKVDREMFKPCLIKAREKHNPDRLLINAHKSVNYKEVIGIMDEAKSAGFENISLVDSRK